MTQELAKIEHYFRNAVEGEYKANVLMTTRHALESAFAHIMECWEDCGQYEPPQELLDLFIQCGLNWRDTGSKSRLRL